MGRLGWGLAGTPEPGRGYFRGACIESQTDVDGGVSLRDRHEPFICATGVLDLSPEMELERESGRGGDSIFPLANFV
jgi:hypothetical protein